jgi:D-glycero-alpha-D-manno-heptose-7-phosphate kinase
LAEEAIEVERAILKETGGLQDQIIAAFGGTCLIHFDRMKQFTVTQLPLPAECVLDLQRHMLLMYTGIQRDSYSVLNRQVERTSENSSSLCKMAKLAESAAELLSNGASMAKFGEMLHESWELKRSLSEISLPVIDEAYEIGMRAGAYGGKLLGAGQGGFLLFIARPELQDAICAALPNMLSLQVGINAPGSRVIFAQNN